MRPNYRAALAVGAVAFLVYLLTLAPTVTLWDAGEFLTAARTLGIPHPPGTPLVVLLGHVWGQLVFFGNYAWRLNVLSAVSSAVTTTTRCQSNAGSSVIDRIRPRGTVDRMVLPYQAPGTVRSSV